jgi:hypothetical protein
MGSRHLRRRELFEVSHDKPLRFAVSLGLEVAVVDCVSVVEIGKLLSVFTTTPLAVHRAGTAPTAVFEIALPERMLTAG